MANIEVTFLKEIADDAARAAQIKAIAQKLADFILATKFNLHIAIYDFRLSGEAADLVVGALNRQAENGIVVRLAYFAPKQKRRTKAAFAVFGQDPAPGPDHSFLDRLHQNIQVKPIEEEIYPTGSANFTEDAWRRQTTIYSRSTRRICAASTRPILPSCGRSNRSTAPAKTTPAPPRSIRRR